MGKAHVTKGMMERRGQQKEDQRILCEDRGRTRKTKDKTKRTESRRGLALGRRSSGSHPAPPRRSPDASCTFQPGNSGEAQKTGSIVNLRRTKAVKAVIRQLAYRSTGVVGEGNKPLLLAGEKRAVDALLVKCIIDLWGIKGGRTGDIDIMEMEGKMRERDEILTSRANKRRGPRYRPPPFAGSAIFRR